MPLCSRHADATTPPVGWTMNDLRTTSGAVAGVADRDHGISSAPPRVRPDSDEERTSTGRMSRRQSIAERARRDAPAAESTGSGDETSSTNGVDSNEPTLFDDEAQQRLLDEKLAERAARRPSAGKGQAGRGPDSRPSRRRRVEEPAAKGEDGFPWTFHLDDEDEPEELQASTPLLSRAFRASTG